MNIRMATIHDIESIRHIAEHTWPDTFRSILSPEQITYMLDMMYSNRSITLQMESRHEFLMVNNGLNDTGFISFEHHYRSLSQTKIHKFYILPSAQGEGAGKALLHEVISRALEAGDDMLTLNVNRYNASIKKYEKMGFEKAGEEDIDIGEGYLMEDTVMVRALKNHL